MPRDPRTGEPVGDADAPHTQLGQRKSKATEKKHPQTREFDKKGKPVRDIEFTDHGRPCNHPNPPQHIHKPNPTGGTPQRAKKAEPLPKWDYK